MAEKQERVDAFLELTTKLTLEVAKKVPRSDDVHEALVYHSAVSVINQAVMVAPSSLRKARRLLSQARKLASFKEE